MESKSSGYDVRPFCVSEWVCEQLTHSRFHCLQLETWMNVLNCSLPTVTVAVYLTLFIQERNSK